MSVSRSGIPPAQATPRADCRICGGRLDQHRQWALAAHPDDVLERPHRIVQVLEYLDCRAEVVLTSAARVDVIDTVRVKAVEGKSLLPQQRGGEATASTELQANDVPAAAQQVPDLDGIYPRSLVDVFGINLHVLLVVDEASPPVGWEPVKEGREYELAVRAGVIDDGDAGQSARIQPGVAGLVEIDHIEHFRGGTADLARHVRAMPETVKLFVGVVEQVRRIRGWHVARTKQMVGGKASVPRSLGCDASKRM